MDLDWAASFLRARKEDAGMGAAAVAVDMVPAGAWSDAAAGGGACLAVGAVGATGLRIPCGVQAGPGVPLYMPSTAYISDSL